MTRRPLFRLLEAANRAFSRVGRGPVFRRERFAWVPEVESAAQEIRAELERVLASRDVPQFDEVVAGQEPLNRDRRWRSFLLFGGGARIEENCRLCPKTVEALGRIPGMSTAMFSILDAGKHIPPHRGPYNGVLRYHLALIVPEGCRIRIGNEIAPWEEGRSLVFDDCFEHEVWNDADSERVVLFVSFTRPLWPPWSLANRLFTAAKRRRSAGRRLRV